MQSLLSPDSVYTPQEVNVALVAHLDEFEGDPARRPLTVDELESFFGACEAADRTGPPARAQGVGKCRLRVGRREEERWLAALGCPLHEERAAPPERFGFHHARAAKWVRDAGKIYAEYVALRVAPPGKVFPPATH